MPEHEDGVVGDALTMLLTATNTIHDLTTDNDNVYAIAQKIGQVQFKEKCVEKIAGFSNQRGI